VRIQGHRLSYKEEGPPYQSIEERLYSHKPHRILLPKLQKPDIATIIFNNSQDEFNSIFVSLENTLKSIGLHSIKPHETYISYRDHYIPVVKYNLRTTAVL
jgi:hypothetical protein